MSYITKPSLVYIVSKKHKGTRVEVVAGTDPQIYTNLIWIDTPIAEATLLTEQIEVYRTMCNDKIRIEAHNQRNIKTNLVLGTEDSEQLRTYEEKYDEASAYLILNTTPTPIMNAEIVHTGETIEGLAPLVVSQYDAAKSALRSMYGDIEGVRRANLASIAVMDLAALEAYAGPTWT